MSRTAGSIPAGEQCFDRTIDPDDIRVVQDARQMTERGLNASFRGVLAMIRWYEHEVRPQGDREEVARVLERP